jgi:hypothetical protein
MILYVCISCSSQNKLPDDVMGVNKMKLILWDMIKASELSQQQYPKDSAALRSKTLERYQTVFYINGITKDEFYKSYRYYQEHPDKNKTLMDSVSAYAERSRINLFKKFR